MIKYDPKKHAELIANYALYIQEKEVISLSSNILALPLYQELYKIILEKKAIVLPDLSFDNQVHFLVEKAQEEMLEKFGKIQTEIYKAMSLDGSIRILAPTDEIQKNKLWQEKNKIFNNSLSEYMKLKQKQKKWTLTLYPTEFAAKNAAMSLEEFEDFVMKAMFLDKKNPENEWKNIYNLQDTLIKSLKGVKEIHFQGEDTDIRINIENRIWANSDGKRNMPSGEIFISPVEDSANGIVFFDIGTWYNGVWVENIRLEFKNGKVINASAEKGEEALLAALDTDKGSRFLGEIGIGTNKGIQRSIGNILFDEKIYGTFHLAIGKSYPETGGQNQSVIHWDMITKAGNQRISIDGKVWQENGEFVNL